MGINVFDLGGRFNLDTSAYERQLDDSVSLANITFSKIGDLAKKGMQMVSDFLKDSVQTASSFDSAMSQVAATMGKASDAAEVQKLREFAREMGENTKFSAIECANALNYMALAGYDVEMSQKMLPSVLSLAAAGCMDLARASDVVTDVQAAMGLTADETRTMIDVMAKTASSSNTSVEQLGDALLTVGASARDIIKNGDMREVATLFGALSSSKKGSEAGTIMRNIIMALSSAKTQKGLAALGINPVDVNGDLRSIIDIMRELRDATATLGGAERKSLLGEMFNKYDLTSVELLMRQTDEQWTDLYQKISDSEGAAGNMMETQINNLNGAKEIFKSAMDEFKIATGESFMPVLVSLTQKATEFVQVITGSIKDSGFFSQVRKTSDLLADAVKTGDTDKIMKQVKGSLHKWIRIFTREIIPEGIAGIINTIFGEGTIDVDNLKKFTSTLGEDLFKGLQKAWGIAQTLWNEVIKPLGQWFFGQVLPPAVSIARSLWDIIKGIFGIFNSNKDGDDNAFTNFLTLTIRVGQGVVDIMTLIANTLEKLATWFNNNKDVDWGGFWDTLGTGEFWENWKNGFYNDILPLFEKFEKVLSSSELGEKWNKMWNKVGEAIETAKEKVSAFIEKIKELIEKIKSLAETISGYVKDNANGHFWDNLLSGLGIEGHDYMNDENYTPTATGGVLTRPTRILAGEAGAEVVMPLQNNTGWIDVLASKIKASGNNNSNTVPQQIVVNTDGAIFMDSYSMDLFIEKVSEKLGALQVQQQRAMGGVNF